MVTVLLLWADGLMAQDIQVTRFDRNYTSLIASMNPMYDNAGEACAVIRFFVRDKDFTVEPNLGVLKQEWKQGEIRLWVPRGTKRLTIRHKGAMTLSGYEIPVSVEPKVTYDAVLEITNGGSKGKSSSGVYIGAGYNILSISGPSLSVGYVGNHHNIELGAVYGLNKSDDWYFYDNNGTTTAAYNYQAIRVQLRYGYEIALGEFLDLTPQIGAAYNLISGKAISGVTTSKDSYKNANSLSVLGALRLSAKLNDNFRLYVMPEYDFGVYKNNTCKLIEKNDSKIKSWTSGVNLNVGLIIRF